MSPSDMFGSKHFATGCATMNINVNIMLTPIHIIRMAPISLEFTKEHKHHFSGLRFISPRWSTTKCLGAQPKSFIAQKWAWLRPQTLGCASSPLDEAQPWKMIFFWSSLVNLCLPDHRLFCLSKNLNQAHFCAINDFGCAPKHLVVLHRGEMKRNPEKMMFSVLW